MKEIIVKKTHELTQQEWRVVADGFNEEFSKEKTAADLINYYCANFAGYSFHALAKDESGVLMGFTSIVPTQYTSTDGILFLTGLSGSSFVLKAYRSDIFIFHDLYKALQKACTEAGYKAILGVPNKNSFKYLVKLVGFKHLFDLPYFVLPVQLKNIFSKKIIQVFSGLFFVVAWLFAKFTQLVAVFYNPKEQPSGFDIYFPEAAYKLRFNASYNTVKSEGYQFTYKIYVEKNIRTAYLFDFRENGQRSFRSLSKAVNHILAKDQIDMIAFVGKLSLKQWLLLELPKSKHPQQLPLTIDVLVAKNDAMYAELCKPESWNFGLMNFDVR